MACTTPIETSPPIADPAAAAARLLERSGADRASRVEFDWAYGDRRGDIEGEGLARFNPPDSLRIDLFTSGEIAMAVALTGEALTSLGEIEDVEIPPRPFLYAMAGLFRPGGGAVPEGYEVEGDTVLVYGTDGAKLYFYARGGRLVKVEEQRAGRLQRKVKLEWGPNSEWPREAEFRDLNEPSRVRWTIGETRVMETPHPADIFILPHAR